MDKIKPILQHKFWILFGFALLLPLIGWWMGAGTLSAAIDKRQAELDGLKVPAGASIPTEDWIGNLSIVATRRNDRLQTAADTLWAAQRAAMTWPSGMKKYVTDQQVTNEDGTTEVRDLHYGEEITIQGLNRFRIDYATEVEQTRQMVRPYDPFYGTGVVKLEPGILPLPDPVTWQQSSTPPTTEEVWAAQEDVWLLRSLLEGVRDLNSRSGADTILKAPIKEIRNIELAGGDTAARDAALAGTATGSEGEYEGEGLSTPSVPAFGMNSFGGEGEGGMTGGAGSADFALAEEVGPPPGGALGATSGESELEYSGESGDGSTVAAAVPLADTRYVDNDPALPFKMRAFKMSLIIDHRQLPEFLVELTNSAFPVRVLRVQAVELMPDPVYGLAATGGMGQVGAAAGYGGGSEFEGDTGGGWGGPTGGLGARPLPGRGLGAPRTLPSRGLGTTRPQSPLRGPLRPGMGSESDFGGGEFGSTGTSAAQLYEKALQDDPFLAEVVVAGLMTIYRAPQEVVAEAPVGETPVAEPAAGGAEPAVTVPEAGAMEPTDPAAMPTGEPGDPAPVDAAPAAAVDPSADPGAVDPTAAPELEIAPTADVLPEGVMEETLPVPLDPSAPLDPTAPIDMTMPVDPTAMPVDPTAMPVDPTAPPE